jgi:hypothetical protein
MTSSSLPVIKDIPPLDPDLLSLSQDESDFFKALTGINDDHTLRKHIIEVQTKAYRVCESRLRSPSFLMLIVIPALLLSLYPPF